MGKKKKHKQHDLEERVAEGAHLGAELAHGLHGVIGKPPANPQGALAHAATTAAVAAAGAALGAGAVLVADDDTRNAAVKSVKKNAKKARKGATAMASGAWSWAKGLW